MTGRQLIARARWRPYAEARMAVFDFIEAFEYPRRRHSALDQLSPAENERRHHPGPPEHATQNPLGRGHRG
jgi:putative transposase